MLATQPSKAQQIDSLVNSGAVIDSANAAYEADNYERAIQLLHRIDPRDTNYVAGLARLADMELDNDQYQDAIDHCDIGLSHGSKFRASFLLTKARATAGMDRLEAAMHLYDSAMKMFPFNASFPYYKGVLFHYLQEYDSAERYFFKTIEINPYFSGAHSYLGVTAMLRGEKTRGMMATGFYVALKNTDNKRLVVLENFVKNELTDEYSIPPTSSNPFLRLDAIIRSGLALDPDYHTSIPIDVGVVRQFQLLFDQLSLQGTSQEDPWIRYYGNWFNEMKQNHMEIPFVYHLLTSTKIEDAHKWLDANDASLQHFYQVVNTTMKRHLQKRTFPALGFMSPVDCEYYDDNVLHIIGAVNPDGKRTGLTYYYNENGEIKAYGAFNDQEQKRGIWRYYNENGQLKSEENEDTGEIKIFNEQGHMVQLYYLKNDKVDGLVKNYFNCGLLRENFTYSNGLKQGPGKTYYANGQTDVEYIYDKDSLTGTRLTYYPDGKLSAKEHYVRGKLEGPYISYFNSGRIRSQGSYLNGLASGEWTYYHDNGSVSAKGSFNGGDNTGLWKYYNVRGQIIEETFYDQEGRLNGASRHYASEGLHYVMDFKNDTLVGLGYFDHKGVEIQHASDPSGTFDGIGYYPGGERRLEFSYVHGQQSGHWKYYYRTGELQYTYYYENGKLEGDAREYYKNGQLKNNTTYANNERNGLYQGYDVHGTLTSAGWFQHDMRQQKWIEYYPSGKVSSDTYYLNDQPDGEAFSYTESGEKDNQSTYHQGELITIVRFRPDGQIASQSETSADGHHLIATRYHDGQVAMEEPLVCGNYEGETKTILPNGKPFRKNAFVNGERSGAFESYYPDGTLEGKGTYRAGQASGHWTWFHENGKPYSEGNYLEDKRDSIWTYYYDNGHRSSFSTYIDDEKNGISETYGLNGKTILIKKYEEGEMIAYRTFDKKGVASDWIDFNGTGQIMSYYENGVLALEETYKKGELDGIRKLFYPSGQIYYQYENVLGKAEGPRVTYHANGKLKEKGTYIDDNRNGTWEFYDENGSLIRREQYSAGIFDGLVEYFSHGKKVQQVKFWAGIPIE